MDQNGTHALSDVLDQIAASAQDDSVTVEDLVGALGQHSFAALILIFTLISTSPASAIPGLTATVGLIVVILVSQMLLGRDCVWLPGYIRRRKLPSEKLAGGIDWMRKPVGFVEQFLKPRLGAVLHRPFSYVPMILVLALALFMPVMEIVPTSGSIASAVIALFAAGLLTRDGVLVLISMLLLLTVPAAVWYFGFSE